MTSVLIVDDEKYVRQSIINRIDWASLNCEIAGEADNGRVAMDLLSIRPVQIVITDIKMPLLDGIGLIREAKALYPHIFFIILSGFPDFQYAKTALQLGVKNFIEKPINIEELKGTIREITALVEQNQSLVTTDCTYRQLIESSDELHLLDHPYYMMAAFRYSGSQQPKIRMELWQEFLKRHKIKGVYSFRVPNIPKVSFLLLCLAEQPGIPIEEIRRLYGLGPLLCPDIHFVSCNSDAANFTFLYYQTITKLKEMVFSCTSEAPDFSVFQENIRLLKNGLSRQEYQLFPQLIHSFSKIHPFTFSMAESLIFELCAEAKKLPESDPQRLLAVDRLSDPYFILNCMSKEQFFNTLIELCQCIFPDKEPATESQSLLFEIYAYIQNNYTNDLTLETISKLFYLSQPYLSSLFKKHTGCGISQYIENLRMDQAKKLLIDYDLSICEVAALIGYNDPNYFSKVFRKHTGISPTKYKTDCPVAEPQCFG